MGLDGQEPYFLVNDFLARDKEQLEQVMREMRHRDPKWKERAIFLRQFTGEVFKAYTRKRDVFADAEKQKVLDKRKQKEILLQKKRELLEQLKKMKEAQQQIQEKKVQVQVPRQQSRGDMSQQSLELKPEVQIESVTEDGHNLARVPGLTAQREQGEEMPVQEPRKEIQVQSPPVATLVQSLSNQEKIQQWVNDPEIREMVCAGPDEDVVIIKNGREIHTEVKLSEQELNQVVQDLGKQAQQLLTAENPFLDAQLNSQTKVQASLGTQYIKGRFAVIKS